MTNPKPNKHLDASKLLGFKGNEAKVGTKTTPATVQPKVGGKVGTKDAKAN